MRRVIPSEARNLAVTARFLVAALLGMTLDGCTPGDSEPVSAEAQAATQDCGALVAERFEDAGLPARDYLVYAPCGLKKEDAPALVMYLHGCNQSAAEAAVQTRWNVFADAGGFVVVYPNQFEPAGDDLEGHAFDGNGGQCWNWFRPEHIQRDAGEAATLAGITRRVMEQNAVHPDRVYVMGTSAGGAMAGVLGATYPEIYAALAINAGVSYPIGADPSGTVAAQAMGAHAQRMPVIVFHGTADEAVVFPTGVEVVQQWLGTNDTVDDGALNGSVPRQPASVEHHGLDESLVAGAGSTGDICVGGRTASPCLGGALGFEESYPYSIEHYVDAAGAPLLDFWILHLATHNYASGDPSVNWSDPLGPDITRAAHDFFAAHPKRRAQPLPPPSGPALSVPPAELAAALQCQTPLARGDRAVLLVHGTSVTPEENWEWNWQRALPHFGFRACTVRLPDYAFVDIQVSAEYVVHAIRAMSDAARAKISVIGLSQGGLQPRWAIRWWPDIRERVDDLVMIVTTNHGAPFADASCAAPPCLPALWQQRYAGSRFLDALNAGDETPGEVSYTSIYSHTDVVVQPSVPVAAAALDGAVNVAVQDLCPGRPVDHAQSSYDAAVWALGFDALSHEGPLDLARVDAAACLEFALPHADPAEAARRGTEIYLVAGERQSTYTGKVNEEPPLRAYVRGEE